MEATRLWAQSQNRMFSNQTTFTTNNTLPSHELKKTQLQRRTSPYNSEDRAAGASPLKGACAVHMALGGTVAEEQLFSVINECFVPLCFVSLCTAHSLA